MLTVGISSVERSTVSPVVKIQSVARWYAEEATANSPQSADRIQIAVSDVSVRMSAVWMLPVNRIRTALEIVSAQRGTV